MTETKNNETDLPKGGELLNVAYFGNTHGSFVRYFIDKFSELTPPVTQSPFDKQGSSDSVDFIVGGQINIGDRPTGSNWQNPNIQSEFGKDTNMYYLKLNCYF